jgi:hypothetical protein
MAGANLTTLSDILKEYYLGPVAEQLNNEVLLLSRLEPKSEDLVGKRAYVPLHVSRSGGIGARAEDAALPDAGNQDYDKAVYDLKYLYGRVRVTGPSMAKTKNEAGAFLQALKSELDGIRNDLKKDLARQVYGKGDGIIAECGTTSSSTTVQLNTDGGKEAIRKGQLYVGMVIDIGTNADVNGKAAGVSITAVDYDNARITISGSAISTTSSDAVRRAGVGVDNGTSGTGSWSAEVDGLKRLVSVGQEYVGEINPATNTWWDNKRINVNGALAAGLEDLQKGMNLIRLEGGTPTVMVTSLGVQREVYMQLEDSVRYTNPDTLTYAAGFKVLEYGGMPIIADIDAPYGRIYMLDENSVKVFSDQDWHFLDADGQTLRQVSGYDAFEAVMTRYMNLGLTKRNNHCVLYGITVDSATDTGI